MINNYKNPTITNWELDDKGNKISIKVLNETHQVVDSRVVLEGFPDVNYRVYIDNMVEIDIDKPIKHSNQYKVDYRTTGAIFFHSSKEGQEITINRYYSKGLIYYPASRIWTKVDNLGNVIETLDGTMERVDEVVEVIIELDEVLVRAEDSKEELISLNKQSIENNKNIKDSISKGQETIQGMKDTIKLGEQEKLDLIDTIDEGEQSRLDLSSKVTESIEEREKLSNKIKDGNSTLDELDIKIDNAQKENKNLKENTEVAKETQTNLNKESDKAEEILKDVLETILKANSTDEELKGTIVEGQELDDRLTAIIEGTDYDKLISDVLELQKNKADKSYVEEQIGSIPKVFHNISTGRVTEDKNPSWFEKGITLCNQNHGIQFPSIGEYGISITLVGDNDNYAQIFITKHGDMWSRRSGMLDSWNGEWYNAKGEIEKKANKIHKHSADDITETNSKKFVTGSQLSNINKIYTKADKEYVDTEVGKMANKDHKHSVNDIEETVAKNFISENDKLKIKEIDNKSNKVHKHSADDITETSSKKFVTGSQLNNINKINNKADKTYVDKEIANAGKVKSVNGQTGVVVLDSHKIPVDSSKLETIGQRLHGIKIDMGYLEKKPDKEDLPFYSDNSVRESDNPIDFKRGVTITNVPNRTYFPTISEFGVCITFIGDGNSGYGQLYITASGEMHTRRSASTTLWGRWYSPAHDIHDKLKDVPSVRKFSSLPPAGVVGENDIVVLL